MNKIKTNIIKALKHPEAADGLYLRNFLQLHEEDSRPDIPGGPDAIVSALNELIVDKKILIERGFDNDVVFRLA